MSKIAQSLPNNGNESSEMSKKKQPVKVAKNCCDYDQSARHSNSINYLSQSNANNFKTLHAPKIDRYVSNTEKQFTYDMCSSLCKRRFEGNRYRP